MNDELNAAVARKLGAPSGNCNCLDVECPQNHNKDYSGSIAAAWEIFEWLIQRNYRVAMGTNYIGEIPVIKWWCHLFIADCLDKPHVGNLTMVDASTPSLAICLAFLKLP